MGVTCSRHVEVWKRQWRELVDRSKRRWEELWETLCKCENCIYLAQNTVNLSGVFVEAVTKLRVTKGATLLDNLISY